MGKERRKEAHMKPRTFHGLYNKPYPQRNVFITE
jgi:hypothetical protein